MTLLGFFGRTLAASALVLSFLVPVSVNGADFKGKTIDFIVGSAPGGGGDTSARLLQSYFEKFLPGSPTMLVRNMPSAGGITALNHVAAQTKPDGLTLIFGSNNQANPLSYRKANATYEPHKFEHVGGLGRGGSVLMVNKDAQARLLDTSKPPVVFGVVDPARTSSQVAAWAVAYLGWNVKWVVGYQGSNQLTLALERGEIDMTTSSNLFQIKQLVDTGKFAVAMQTGAVDDTGKYVGRSEFGNAPVLAAVIKEKVKDPVALEAFGYWESADTLDKWVSLNAGTPKDIVEAYRTAFEKMAVDPVFLERGKNISEDLTPMAWREIDRLMIQMSKRLTEK